MPNKNHKPLFASSADLESTARIIQGTAYGLSLFAEGYKSAADILVKHAIDGSADRETLVYPTVFLYRQYIELRLKEILREGSALLDDARSFPKRHELDLLWPPVRQIIEAVWAHEDTDDAELLFVDRVITEFFAIDPKSMSFRYPGLLGGVNEIDLRHLSQTIDRVFMFLDGVSDAISAYRDFSTELAD